MKTMLIVKREYLTRVRKKSFILTTILVPLLFVALIFGTALMAVSSSSTKKIAVLDESGVFAGKFKDDDDIKFTYLKSGLEEAKQSKDYDGVLHIPSFDQKNKNQFSIYSEEQIGLGAQNEIKNQMNDVLINERMQAAGISTTQLDSLQKESITVKNINGEGKSSDYEKSIAIGYASGFLLYMFMLLYGMSVMRSVMEEKTNRIAEIIVSSVKPFQLMLGKIIGVALVGLTQFLIWVILIGIVTAVGGVALSQSGMMGSPEMAGQMAQQGQAPDVQNIINVILGSTNWVEIIVWFLFYFLGGYFLYASLFAAVGSLVNEDPQDAQQLTLPITLPIIFGFVIMSLALKDPNSGIAIFGSIFPLTSPIVMMARIPFGVPAWQIALSAALLILGFIGTTWMAGKIYRTGILLYGKKVTLKEVGKWLVRK